MKQKYAQARKANRLCLRYPNRTSEPVWIRRVRGIYGPDFRNFDKRHPRVEDMVQGIRANIERAKQAAQQSPAE